MSKKYRIKDKLFHSRYFADGAIYDNRIEVYNQLIDYHNIDWVGTQTIHDTLPTLEDVLDYGEWEIEEVEEESIDHPYRQLAVKILEAIAYRFDNPELFDNEMGVKGGEADGTWYEYEDLVTNLIVENLKKKGK